MTVLTDLVLEIVALSKIETDDWYVFQDVMIGNANWNRYKDKMPELQGFENIMGLLILEDIREKELNPEIILRLLAIFINLFQISYMACGYEVYYHLLKRMREEIKPLNDG